MADIIINNVGPRVTSQFSELRIAQRTPIVELTSVYGLSDLRDIVTATGGGSVTNNGTEYLVSTTTGAADSATLDSALRGRYEPGYAGQAGIGVRLPINPVGSQVVTWGLFDDENGAYFGVDSSGFFLAVRRDGVDTIITPVLFSEDPLDGSGPSNITLDLAEGHIFQIVFTWYGYGVIEFRLVEANPVTGAQEVYPIHRYSPSGETSFIDPNLPLRAEVDNNGTANALTLFVAGRQYGIIGKYNPIYRITSERRSVNAVPATLVPVISFRRKTEFPSGSGRPNSIDINLDQISIIASNDISYQVLLGGTVDGTFVNFPTANTNIPDNETGLLVNNTSTTITGGETLFQGVSSGGAGVSQVTLSQSLLDFNLPTNEIVTLAVSNLGSAANIIAVFRVTESW